MTNEGTDVGVFILMLFIQQNSCLYRRGGMDGWWVDEKQRLRRKDYMFCYSFKRTEKNRSMNYLG